MALATSRCNSTDPGHLLVERVTLEALQTFLDEVPWEQLTGVTDS